MIFGEGKNISSWWRRKMGKEKEQKIWRRNRYLVHGGEGKERKYLFCGGEEKRCRKRRKIFGEGKIFGPQRRRRTEKEKRKIVQRR